MTKERKREKERRILLFSLCADSTKKRKRTHPFLFRKEYFTFLSHPFGFLILPEFLSKVSLIFFHPPSSSCLLVEEERGLSDIIA